MGDGARERHPPVDGAGGQRRRARFRSAAPTHTTHPPSARSEPLGASPGAAAQLTFVVVVPFPDDEVVTEIFAVRTPFSESMHCMTSLALMYSPSQMMAPIDSLHCVVQLLESWFRHCSKLLSWHCS